MPSGKHRKKKKVLQNVEPEDAYKPPKSFIFRRGKVGQTVKQLVEDMRQVMSPNTAVNLQEKETNTLKDFVQVSSQLGISQFFVFSATEIGTYLRLLRIPHGPTLTFRVMSYSLMSDIHKLQSRPKSISAEDKQCAPILILNNFSSEENHIKLMASAFQNAFPALNVHLMKLKEARRVVLLHYDKEDATIEFRHYLITTAQLGITKSVKRVLQRKISDMGDTKDISEFILSQTGATESDAEDMANVDGQIDLPDTLVPKKKRRFTKKKVKKPTSANGEEGAAEEGASSDENENGSGDDMDVDAAPSVAGSENMPQKYVKSAVRLTEVGPRMLLKLIKIEEGFNDGLVLFHALKTKTEKEVQAQERKRAKAAALKEKRKKEQEERVERKKRAKLGVEDGDADVESSDEKADHEDYNYDQAPEEVVQKPDDVEWYRQEVGEEPTEEEKRELRASQPAMGKQNKFNPHWGKKSKKRSGDEVTGGRGSEKHADGKPPAKKFKTISGSIKRTK
jgi:ribosome biogenesis protein SSF1/2